MQVSDSGLKSRPLYGDRACWEWTPVVMAVSAGMWLAACMPLGRTAPQSLPGSIYAARTGEFVAAEEFVSTIASIDFVLLGEMHDNPEHHRLQARLIAAIAETGRRPAIVFEMLNADQAVALDRHLSQRPEDALGLGPAVGWERRGWPPWSDYLPIGQAALSLRLPIVVGDLGRATLTATRVSGIAGLPPSLVDQLGLNVDYEPRQQRELERLLQESHCDGLPASALARMVTIQRARDGSLAKAMHVGDRQSSGGAVLIAGSGHVRNDFGVPWHLKRRAPRRSVATVAFTEIDPDKPKATDYAYASDGAPLFDYIWFTTSASRDDPCVGRVRPKP
ncbi:MAG TPA: ChaN family lipoprotein [Alphaproteobacteria bacterium]|nr:ChaN family lipoprotein [Alphaproteobacteria bacterium]